MTINIHLHQIVMMLGAVLSFMVLLVGWPRRKAIGGFYFVAFSFSVTWWLIAGTVESFVVDQSAKILWSQILYIGFTQTYPCLFLFIISYIRQRKIHLSIILALMVIPFSTLILAWTNSFHGWVWSGYSQGSIENNVLIFQHGFWFWVHVVYLYSVLLTGLVYLIRNIVKSPPAFRRQLLIILAGIIFPIITGTMYVLGLEPVPGMDITPTGLVFTGMFLALGLLRYQLLDLLPIARTVLVEQLQDGVIVLDLSGRIVDINQATQNLLEWNPKVIFGKDIAQISPTLAELVSQTKEQIKREISLPDSLGTILEVQSSTLFNENHQEVGKLLVIHDITDRKLTESLLEKTRENYKAFFNSKDDFLFVLDQNGNILHTNNTVTKRLGYSEEELFGSSVLMVHPPERREEAGRIVGEMLAGTAEFCPVPIMKKTGEQISVETRVTPGFWDGKPVIFGVTKDISQIKLSEEKFSRAFQLNSALMALSHFEDGAYIDVNDVFLKTLGFTRDEVIGKTSKELHVFAEADQRNKIVEKIKQNKAVKDVEVEIRTKDGSLRNGLFSADTIYIGKDLCLLTVMVDITERKQMEMALRESQSLYHSLVEVSPLSICRKDLAGRFTFANRRFLELSQITLADLVGKTDFDLHPPELAEKYRRDDQAVINSRQVQELIEERAVIGGESSVVQSIKTPIYDGTGKINGIQISFWDITDRKRAEEALRLSEAMFHALFEFAPDAIVATNHEGNIMRANAQAEMMFGYCREELGGHTIEFLMPERFAHRHVDHRIGYTANPYARAMGTGFDFYGRRKDGSEFPVDISMGTLETGSGTLILSVIRDITARKQAEAELHLAKESLEMAHHELEQSFAREQQLAHTDELTGINNRRFLFELAEREFNGAMRYRLPLSVLMYDIDDFKQINDTFGHAMGDQVLERISKTICTQLRSTDIIGRYGGDEFVILLPQTSAQEALPLAERIHGSVAAMYMETGRGLLTLAISIGIAQMIHDAVPGSGQSDSLEKLFLRVDQALYAAKQAGKNRTVIFDPDKTANQ